MQQNHDVLRIITLTGGLWRADQLAEYLAAIDGLVCRTGAAHTIGEILRRHNEELASLQAMGLLRPGLSPDQWPEASRGTDAVARQGYLAIATALRRHGIRVRQDHLGWSVEFEFKDILEIVPRSQRLEVEFIHMSSPGAISLTQAGLSVARETGNTLTYILDTLISPKAARLARLAAAEIARQQARRTRGEADQAIEIARILREFRRRMQTSAQPRHLQKTETGLDSTQRIDAVAAGLREGGLSHQQTMSSVVAPLEQSVDRIARFVCERLSEAIAVEIVKHPEQGESKNRE